MTGSRLSLTVSLSILILAVIMAGIWWINRSQKPDEQQIKELLARAERAVEDTDLSGLMGLIADDYDDGLYDKRALRRAALAGFCRYQRIRVTPVLRKLKISGKSARASLDVDLWLDAQRGGPPVELSLWVELEKQRGRWLITSAGGDWPEAPHQFHNFQ